MAIPPVVLDFHIKNIPDVQRAFKSIQQTFEQSERVHTRAAETGARARLRAANDESKALVKAAEKTAKNREAIQTRSALMAGRLAAKAAKDEARAVEDAEREKTKSVEKWARTREAIQTRSALMAGRLAAKAAKEEAAAREKEERASYARRQKFASTVMGAARTAGRTVMGGVQRTANTLLQVGGGFSVADSIKEQGEFERSAIGLSNSAYMGTGKRMSAKELQIAAKTAGIRTGQDQNDILKAAHAFGAKTGKYDEAVSNMEMFGQIAKGTGADIGDVAKAAGILRVQNEDLTGDKMKGLLLQTVRQGQKGSIEFSDLASATGKITRTSSSYAGNQDVNQGKLLGLAQVAMRTAGSPEEAATVLSNVSADAMKHHDKFKKGTFDAKGRIAKAPEEFLADVLEQQGGNLQKIQAMGFGARSMKMFQALAPTYEKGGKEGVLKDIRGITEGQMSDKELETNVKNILNTSAEQFEAGVRQLKMAVGEQLLPELAKLVPVLQQLIPYLTRFLEGVSKIADWALSNPLGGLGAAIMALITKEIVAAQISQTIQRLISGAAPGAAGGGAGGAGGVVAAGMAGQVAAVYKIGADTADAYKGGQAEGASIAEMMKSPDPAVRAKGQQMAQAAQQKAGGGSAAAGYVDRALDLGISAFNPFAAVGRYAGNQAAEALGGKSSASRANEAIKADQTIKAPELAAILGKIEANTRAGGGGKFAGGGSTDTSNRVQNIAQRTGK